MGCTPQPGFYARGKVIIVVLSVFHVMILRRNLNGHSKIDVGRNVHRVTRTLFQQISLDSAGDSLHHKKVA